MAHHSSPAQRAALSRAALASVILMSVAFALLASGCSSIATPGPSSMGGSAKPSASTASNMTGMAKSKEASGMVCVVCSGKGKSSSILGNSTVENGVQVVTIALKDGTYKPNTFTLKAGAPVKVSFEGTATGCLGHPTFKSLGKTVDVTHSSGSLDLGNLAPGTYKFGCAMGMNTGTITVQ